MGTLSVWMYGISWGLLQGEGRGLSYSFLSSDRWVCDCEISRDLYLHTKKQLIEAAIALDGGAKNITARPLQSLPDCHTL